jgi:2-polyprenyl-6-hydroxyphenyl methylase/3-demethylubiquinone-9 3-methyltransferase
MARLGFTVTGVDASAKNVGVASAHAAETGLQIDYRNMTVEELLAEAAGGFDVVLNMEVVEHVNDPGQFLRDASRLVKPGGVMVVATLNRTLKALATAKIGAEYVLGWLPRGAHDWRKFLTPEEVRLFLSTEPVAVHGPFGVAYNPLADRWSLGRDASVNYMMTVERP